MFPHDHEALALRGSVQEVGETLEAATKDAVFHKMLVGQEMLSESLHVSPEILAEGIPHVHRVVLRSCWH